MSDAPDGILEKITVPMPVSHGWQCKPGNNLFVAERGAVAFEIPQGWVVQHDGKQTVSVHDRLPPADEARISLTVFHLPPVEGGWGKLPLAGLLEQAAEATSKPKKARKRRKPRPKPQVHTEPRHDLELAWVDKGCWTDAESARPIYCRQIMARARLVQAVITFDVYQDAADRFESAWKDLLRSLRLAVPRDITGQIGN